MATFSRFSRRRFLRNTAFAATGTALFSSVTGFSDGSAVASLPVPEPMVSASGKVRFHLGIASYTFRAFDRAQVIAWCKQLALPYACFKDVHLPLKADDTECAAATRECAATGVRLYGCGTVTFASEQDIDNAFRYAKAAGMDTIVCTIGKPELVEPLLAYLDGVVKKGDIVAAIHNHGPGDRTFPTAQVVYEKVKDLDRRIGFCVDIGHSARIGADPLDDLTVCPERLYDIHFKDITSADAPGKSCVLGRGVLDIPKIVATLVEIGYDKRLSFEYEENAKSAFPYVAESVGYARGLVRMF